MLAKTKKPFILNDKVFVTYFGALYYFCHRIGHVIANCPCWSTHVLIIVLPTPIEGPLLMVSLVLAHNTSRSLPIIVQKLLVGVFNSKCLNYKSFDEYWIFPWPKSNTPCCLTCIFTINPSFLPNLQSLRGIPNTLLVGNLYFSGYPMLSQPRLLYAPQPFLVLILEL